MTSLQAAVEMSAADSASTAAGSTVAAGLAAAAGLEADEGARLAGVTTDGEDLEVLTAARAAESGP